MTKKLVWLPSFGADPNEAGGSSQRPNIWLGEWWLRSKQPLYALSRIAPIAFATEEAGSTTVRTRSAL
jgi:hypothetical protein